MKKNKYGKKSTSKEECEQRAGNMLQFYTDQEGIKKTFEQKPKGDDYLGEKYPRWR